MVGRLQGMSTVAEEHGRDSCSSHGGLEGDRTEDAVGEMYPAKALTVTCLTPSDSTSERGTFQGILDLHHPTEARAVGMGKVKQSLTCSVDSVLFNLEGFKMFFLLWRHTARYLL